MADIKHAPESDPTVTIPPSVDPDLKYPVHVDEKLAKRSSDDSSGIAPLPVSELNEGEEEATDEDLETLRRVADKIPKRAYTIAFVELVERMSYYGTTAVYVNYIQQPNPGTSTGRALNPNDQQAQPGALGKGQRTAFAITTFNQFWVYCLPLLGAYIADTYLGRYRTVTYAIFIAIAGHLIQVAGSAPSVIKHVDTSLGVFLLGLIVVGIGTGGFKPNISPLIAEQIPARMFVKRIKKTGERVLVDPAVTISRIYNYFYLFTNIGSLVGQISMVYAERYVGFWLSYLLPTVMFATSIPVMLLGRKFYKETPPQGSVLLPAIKILTLAAKGRWHLNPITTYKSLTAPDFWENVKPSKFTAETRPAWMDFDDAWVDEVARGWASIRVFTFLPLYWLTYNQLNNNLVSQAATMSLHGVPNDIVNNLNPLSLVIFIPIVDHFFYPALRRFGFNFTPIKRIFAGFMLGTAAMIYSAVLQYYIYKTNPCGKYAGTCEAGPSTINVWAQTGAYILIGFSEIFASITSLSYAFEKAPRSMKSLVMSFSLFMTAIGSALNQALTPLSEDPHLIWNYGASGIMAFVGGIAFYFTFRELDRNDDRLNRLAVGRVHGNAEILPESIGTDVRKNSVV